MDRNRLYEFPQEFDELNLRRKVVSLRRSDSVAGEEDTGSGVIGKSLQFMSSQVLAESSLSTELSQMDYSTTFDKADDSEGAIEENGKGVRRPKSFTQVIRFVIF